MTAAGTRPAGLSRGFLPLAALRSQGPTAVAKVDLEASLQPAAPDGRPLPESDRDCLLLVRLRGAPLAVLHLDKDPASMPPEELAAEIWRLAGEEIKQHARSPGSRREIPDEPRHLLDELEALDGRRPGGERPAGTGTGAVILSTTGGDPAQLRRCLESLTRQRHQDFEVIVVDNRPGRGSTRELVGEMAAEDARVRYVAEPRAGLSVARNRGLTETDADLVAFTDDDVVVDPLWLDWLLEPFSDPTVAVGCGMVLPLALETEAQKRFERYLGFSRGVERRLHDLQTGLDAEVPFYPFLADIFGSGNSMAFRREDLLRIGGFDPALGAGSPTHAGEETDAFSRTILDGGRIVYEPRALSWHEHRRDNEALRSQIFGYGVGVGALVTKALTHDRRFYRAAAAHLVPLTAGATAASRVRKRHLDLTGAADAFGELLRARRVGIAQGPFRYLQGLTRARKLGLWCANPEAGRKLPIDSKR